MQDVARGVGGRERLAQQRCVRHTARPTAPHLRAARDAAARASLGLVATLADAELTHAPPRLCSTGEIDILEGVNDQSPNQATLHTSSGQLLLSSSGPLLP